MEELLYNADGTYNLEKLLTSLKASLAEVSSQIARVGEGEDEADASEGLVEQMQQHETFLLGRPDPAHTNLNPKPSAA